MHVFQKNCPIRNLLLLLFVLLLAGCAAGRSAFNRGEAAMAEKNYDLAVTSFLTATQKEPDSYPYRMKLQLAREQAAQHHKARGDELLAKQNYLGALQEYQLANDLDGSYYAANEGIALAGHYLQAQKMTAEAEELLNNRKRLQAKDAVEKALQQVSDYQPALQLLEKIKSMPSTVVDGVELEVTSTKPITLNFNDVKLPDVFDILTKLSGINFILDEDVRSNKTTLFLEKATFAQALELLLRMNKLDKKVLNSKTIILFPKSRDKQKQFEDQLIQTFYLSNIDAKKAVNLLRTMLQVRKIYVNEELNAIILRDSPDVIRLAQKIIEANDRSNSEVIFDLELIEVSNTDVLKLGPKLAAYELQVGINATPLSVTTGTSSTPVTTSQIGSVVVNSFNGLEALYGLPSGAFDFLKTFGNGEVLASPKIRVKNKEKAKVHIGSREPTITVTINGDQTTESVQYVDVGVKLDVEPTIQLDNTVVTKLGLEVSNVSDRTTTSNGTNVLTISTTNATTSLTLKDGERTIIGGLLRDSVTDSRTTIPLLGDIPLLGKLFTYIDKNKTKREILLSITPHIVKSVTLPDTDVASIWSGGEDDLKYGRNFGSFADEYRAGQEGLTPEVKAQPEVPGLQPTEQETQPPPEMPPALPSGATLEQPAAGGAGGAGEQTVSDAAAAPDGNAAASGAVPPPVETAPPPTDQTLVQAKTVPPNEPVAEVKIAQNQQPETLSVPKIFIQGAQLVKVGETFTITIDVAEINSLFSAPMYVRYDPRFFEFIGATEGSFLKKEGGQTIFTHTGVDRSGRIIVGLKQGVGGQGISGSGDLFSMQFKALVPGTSEIRPMRTNFRNPQGERLQAKSTGLSIEITE